METKTKIQTIDRKVCKMVRDAVEAGIQAQAKALGLDVVVGGGKFDPETYTMKVKFSIPISNLAPKTTDQESMEYGLAPRGTRVKVGMKVGTIQESRRAKYVVVFDDKPEVRYLVRFTSCKMI